MSLCDGRTVYERLKRSLPPPTPRDFVALEAKKHGSLFTLLVGIVLSQNTNDRNAIRAFNALVEKLGEVTPEKLLSAPREEILEAIKPAGMHRRRLETLLELARFFLEHPRLEEEICRMGVEDARKLLMSVKGIGPKTVDVALMHYCGFPLFPVDTHISRILERWGVKGGYEEKRRWGERFFPPEQRMEAHMLLIQLGRYYCKARNPRCGECPLRDCCPYAKARVVEGGETSSSDSNGGEGEGTAA